MGVKRFFADVGVKVKSWLAGLSFRTGVIVLVLCIPLHILAFVPLLLPVGESAKAVLFVVFFGLAKIAQYGGLTILGAEGLRRLKSRLKRQ